MAGEGLRKALVIHPGRVNDMGDLLAIARAEGRKAFCTKANIHVHPWIGMMNNCFVVVVDDEVGRTGTQVSGKVVVPV